MPVVLTAACFPAKETASLRFEGTGTIVVEMSGFRNDHGVVWALLFSGPEEGFGVSNGLGHRFSPPDFEEARFMLLIDRLVVPVKVQYLENIRDERRKERRGE